MKDENDSLAEIVGHSSSGRIWLGSFAHPEESVGSGAVVMQIRDVERLGVE